MPHADAQTAAYEAARQALTDDQISAAITSNALNRSSAISEHPVPDPRKAPSCETTASEGQDTTRPL